MENKSSFDRIVSYFHALARQPFEYRDKIYTPYNELILSEKVFRSFTCPENCGACCMRTSLVWDDTTDVTNLTHTDVDYTVNGVSIPFKVDTQDYNTGDKCTYLSKEGRCGIYTQRPLPCRFELFKFIHSPVKGKATAMVKLPGRNWVLKRVDGVRGALCEIIPYDKSLTDSHVSDLIIIKGWMDSFEIKNNCSEAIRYLETGPHSKPLRISNSEIPNKFFNT
jgi:Fe-S-cluster containining protein